MCVCLCVTEYLWRSGNNSGALFSFYCVSPWDQVQTVRLGDKSLYLVSHLTSPDKLSAIGFQQAVLHLCIAFACIYCYIFQSKLIEMMRVLGSIMLTLKTAVILMNNKI